MTNLQNTLWLAIIFFNTYQKLDHWIGYCNSRVFIGLAIMEYEPLHHAARGSGE